VNIGQLRLILAELPVDMPVVIDDCQMGWMTNTALYLAPAHIDYGITGNRLSRDHQDGGDNCQALLISSLEQVDVNVVDITPRTSGPQVVEGYAEDIDSAGLAPGQLDAGAGGT
jgi:hypothetical protein